MFLSLMFRGIAHGCMSPHHRRSIFVTAPLVFSRVSIFCPWTSLGTSVPQTPWFVPLSEFLATPLLMLIHIHTDIHTDRHQLKH